MDYDPCHILAKFSCIFKISMISTSWSLLRCFPGPKVKPEPPSHFPTVKYLTSHHATHPLNVFKSSPKDNQE